LQVRRVIVPFCDWAPLKKRRLGKKVYSVWVLQNERIGKINVTIVSEIMGPVTTSIRVKKLTGRRRRPKKVSKT
jgi:hypothetical protein